MDRPPTRLKEYLWVRADVRRLLVHNPHSSVNEMAMFLDRRARERLQAASERSNATTSTS